MTGNIHKFLKKDTNGNAGKQKGSPTFKKELDLHFP